MDENALNAWIGRTETTEDIAAAGPVMRLAALLDHDGRIWRPGEMPPLAHWLYFLPAAAQSQIGEDGHPQRGGLLPPVALPRRMWAGGEIEFVAPIALGARLSRCSTVQNIAPKTGKSGAMVFVTLRHEIFADGILAIIERQDIVYREAAGPAAAVAAPAEVAAVSPGARIVHPDPVLLFRFSALTFNAHRIHYDRDYARDVESYPGLVVHGPLIATLLMDHFLRAHPGREISRFSFRAQSPLLDTAPFALNHAPEAGGFVLWAARPEDKVAMSAKVETA
jgi:3-methylfumaryl-CoA hydratase